MNIQHILDTGEVDEHLDTATLEEASSRIEQLLAGLRESNWGPVGEAFIKKYQATASRLLDLLNKRPHRRSERGRRNDPGKQVSMDFRIIVLDDHQVLLERILEENQWQVVIGVFLDKVTRYDEWFGCVSAEQACDCIAGFEEGRVYEFLERAQAWYAKEYDRIASREVS